MSGFDWRQLSPPRLLAPWRLRLLFRGAFLLLILATVSMAIYMLQQEQRLSYRNYEALFHRNEAQIAARLRHPAGQLALLNPPQATVGSAAGAPTRLHPLLLPFSALDYDDPAKVQQAIEMAGCMVEYPSGGQVCVAIGNNPWVGGFIYVAGSFVSGDLVSHRSGDSDLGLAHRLQVAVDLRGRHEAWIAPFEASGPASAAGLRGRLTGFPDIGNLQQHARPVRDFRGWLWQASDCVDPLPPKAIGGCDRRSFFSVRLPVTVLRDALFDTGKPVWPPRDLNRIEVHVQILPPGDGPPLLDSAAPQATPPFSLNDLTPLLLPGETLHIRKASATRDDLVTLNGPDNTLRSPLLIDPLLRWLVFDGNSAPLEARETIATPLGDYELLLAGDAGSANRAVSAVATRMTEFVSAMLLVIVLAWLALEIGIIRRITLLTQRANSIARIVKTPDAIDDFHLDDLRGADELGVLAGCLADLLHRVREDVVREHIRAEQEKDLWHAVGHEIMSPLQSLMALHGDGPNGSRRYIDRMQQAVRVLYGNASPSEAFQSTTFQTESIDLGAFLGNVAQNAPCVGIEQVIFTASDEVIWVRVNEHALEDVVTHVLTNAERYREPGTAIRIHLEAGEIAAIVRIQNQGPSIDPGLIERIFEYGVSDPKLAGAQVHRGQGLFVAKTYMAKMGGTISVRNTGDGVFVRPELATLRLTRRRGSHGQRTVPPACI